MSIDVGVVGLGSMGSVLAANLVDAGHRVVTYDVAGPARAPVGASFVGDVASLAAEAEVVVLSLPDGGVSTDVAQQLGEAEPRRVRYVVDTSTTGVHAAQRIAGLLDSVGVGFVDAPVSGGPAGARARTLMVMYAGEVETCAAVEPVLAGLSDRRRRVGDRPGLGQAVKLANNFLSATALAAASEAVAFGTSLGLEMSTMLDVINASSGRSAATSDKFVEHVATGRYASGFTSSLMNKDVQLYLRAVTDTQTAAAFGSLTAQLWESFAAAEPGADFTRIYPFVAGS